VPLRQEPGRGRRPSHAHGRWITMIHRRQAKTWPSMRIAQDAGCVPKILTGARCLGSLLPRSPPAEKATARRDEPRHSAPARTGITYGWRRTTLTDAKTQSGGRCHKDNAFSIPVVCELRAAEVIGFARTVGLRSIRASNIRAIAIMTNAVETNRILSSPLS
jgi:hypothetical protein